MHSSLMPGQSIGPYLVQAKIATGTFGTIYLVAQDATAVPVVLKAITPPGAGQLAGSELFVLGQRLLTLQHPSILLTLDVRLTHDPPYVVTRYVCGGTLGQRLLLRSPFGLPISQVIPIVQAIGEALSYMHAQHIVHRSVQPSCILFDVQGQALLSGFDLARREDHPAPARLVHTTSYAAPEQQGSFTPSSDLYALGRIAYQLLTGATPQQQSPAHLVHLIAGGQIPRPMGRAVLRAIADAPEQRWPNMNAFLTAFLEGEERSHSKS